MATTNFQTDIRRGGKRPYPAPPGASPFENTAPAPAPSTSAAPAPAPPQFAPPPPQTQGYGVSGPPSPAGSAPAAAAPSTPFASKGAMAPGFATGAGARVSYPQMPETGAGVTGGPAATGPQVGAGTGAGPFGDDASYLAHVKGTIDSTISDAQWMAWKKDLDSGCPSNKPFKTSRPGPGGPISGPERCVEKPDNCPDGMRVIGNDRDGSARCLPEGDRAFGGGPTGISSGPGGGGGGGGLGGLGGGAGAGGLEGLLQQIISGQLTNPVSRYTPEAMATLLSGTKATAEDQSQAERDAINEDAAARGVLGAGATGTALANARIAANRTVAGEQQNIAREKINADYQDKVTAIQQAQQSLDSQRDWLYKQQMTQMQRQQFEANLTMAYARLQQEWDMLQANAAYGMLG